MKVAGFLTALAWIMICCACASQPINQAVIPVVRGQMALRIVCAPEEAQVRIDGVPQGSCRWLGKDKRVVMLEAGEHELEVRAAGYVPFVSFFSAEGMQQSLSIHLTRGADVERTAQE